MSDADEVRRDAPPKWWERVGAIETAHATCEAMTGQRLASLEENRKQQNGHFLRIEAAQVEIGKQLNAFQASSRNWQVGLLVGIVIALIMLVVNLTTRDVDSEVSRALDEALPRVVRETVVELQRSP